MAIIFLSGHTVQQDLIFQSVFEFHFSAILATEFIQHSKDLLQVKFDLFLNVA
jgi:hypothetical protein